MLTEGLTPGGRLGPDTHTTLIVKTNKQAGPEPALIQAIQFQAITFYDAKLERQVIMLYALGEDGILREFQNGKWNEFPITKA
jgi:hypothetical protein